jgi:hypothetical protein
VPCTQFFEPGRGRRMASTLSEILAAHAGVECLSPPKAVPELPNARLWTASVNNL